VSMILRRAIALDSHLWAGEPARAWGRARNAAINLREVKPG
jgi:hypothetical protein